MQDEKILVTQSSMPPYEEYIEAIKPLWDSHWLTNMGKYHKELEEKLRTYLDVPELSLMVNGHMSLEMTIQAFNFPEGSEVITTPFTFISTTHAIVRNRLKPVFCDVKLSDGTIDGMPIGNNILDSIVDTSWLDGIQFCVRIKNTTNASVTISDCVVTMFIIS